MVYIRGLTVLLSYCQLVSQEQFPVKFQSILPNILIEYVKCQKRVCSFASATVCVSLMLEALSRMWRHCDIKFYWGKLNTLVEDIPRLHYIREGWTPLHPCMGCLVSLREWSLLIWTEGSILNSLMSQCVYLMETQTQCIKFGFYLIKTFITNK